MDSPSSPSPVRPVRLIALHGFDDDPAALSALAQHWVPSIPGADAVVPAGPVATPGGRAWWMQHDDGSVDEAECRASCALVADLLRAADDDGRDAVLVGFSQGAAMALTALLEPSVLPVPRTIAVVAGWIPDLPGVAHDRGRAAGATVLVAHGELDEVVPVANGRATARFLERQEASVTLATRPVGHELAAFGPVIVDWLAAGRIT